MTVWIAADVKSDDGLVWELIGVFDSAEKAESACTEYNHAYFPIEMNLIAPKESTIVPDVKWPKLSQRPCGAGLINAKAN
jgi:hypothetical protein